MRRILAVVVCCAVLLAGAPVNAQQARWDPTWAEFGVADVAVTAGFAVVAITAEIFGGPATPRWQNEVLFDLPVRQAIGARSVHGERRAALVTDLSVALMMAAPLLDAGLVGYGVHRDVKLATNLSLLSLESFALTFGVTSLTKVLVGRSRPRVAACFVDPETPCDERPNVSFFSGHSSVAFTGAGLICAFGTVAQMHGGGASGQVPCASALAVAGATAMLRVAANKHHTTDVIVGTVVGLASGWLWPAVRLAWQ